MNSFLTKLNPQIKPTHKIINLTTVLHTQTPPNNCFIFVTLIGAAYGHSEDNLRRFIEQTGLPFLPTPMGKGVVSDNHPQCVSAARSK